MDGGGCARAAPCCLEPSPPALGCRWVNSMTSKEPCVRGPCSSHKFTEAPEEPGSGELGPAPWAALACCVLLRVRSWAWCTTAHSRCSLNSRWTVRRNAEGSTGAGALRDTHAFSPFRTRAFCVPSSRKPSLNPELAQGLVCPTVSSRGPGVALWARCVRKQRPAWSWIDVGAVPLVVNDEPRARSGGASIARLSGRRSPGRPHLPRHFQSSSLPVRALQGYE